MNISDCPVFHDCLTLDPSGETWLRILNVLNYKIR